MDEDHQFLQPRAPLLPTSVPHGVEEALRSIRYHRQTGQVPPRVGHEDQTPVVSKGCSTPPAIVVEAQLSLAVLIAGFPRPPLQIPADDLGGPPVDSVGDQHHRAARPRLLLATHHEAALAPARETDAQRAVPGGMPAHGDGAIGLAGDQRHAVLDREVRARPLQGPARGLPPLQAGRFQPAVLVEPTAPVRSPPGPDLDHRRGQGPGVEHDDTTGPLVPDGLFH
jgi:hypothetical protein